MPHPGGRPSKYDPKYLKVMDEYLREAVPENMDIPTVEGFALKIDVSDRALFRWGKKYPEFRRSLRKLKITQKQHLLRTGIFGGKEINPQIIALALRVNHKMVEVTKSENKNDHTSNGKELNPILVKFLDESNKHSE